MALFDDRLADIFRCGSSASNAASTVRDDEYGSVFQGNDGKAIFPATWSGVFLLCRPLHGFSLPYFGGAFRTGFIGGVFTWPKASARSGQ